MNEQSEEPILQSTSADPVIHIDWGYARPSRGSQTTESSVVRREITIEPPPTRLATPAEGTIVVVPRLRQHHADYRIWITAFSAVTALTLAVTTLIALALTLF